MATSNLMGTTLTATDGNSNGIGFYITPNKDCRIVSVIKSSTCNATTAYIYDSSKSLLSSASFSGDIATFAQDITNGSNYYVISRGHSIRHYGTTGSYPRNRTDLTYTNNAYMTSSGDSPSSLVTGIGEDANITDIQTQVAQSFLVSENMALAESTDNLRTRLFTNTETLSLSETITALKGIAFEVLDNLGLVETFTSLRSWLFSISENLNISELTVSIKQLWTKTTKNNTSWTDRSKNDTTWTNITKN